MIRIPKTSAIPVVSYRDCPAKTYLARDGRIVPGRTVFEHCLIVGHVARALIAIYPETLQRALFPAGTELVVACHDIGKVSPTFYVKITARCDATNLPALKGVDWREERIWGYHAGTGSIACRAMNAPAHVADIVGQHHGSWPQTGAKLATDGSLGGSAWQQERERLVADLKQAFQQDWPVIRSDAQARLLAGLTTVSDWIGSGESFEDPAQKWRPLIEQAVSEAGFIPPVIRPGLSFEAMFGFAPHPVQRALIDQVQGPGVYVLEAPMGVGKTEAALYAAYRILCRRQACGIYFALPTQLTSNKLYERFQRFLQKVLAEDSPRHARLLHSQAQWLEMTSMGEAAAAGGSWFDHRKRGLLAPFAVGTLDQALMSVINVEHGFVRAFGLAGKVVILDEVHSYDAYTGALLDALIALLRELQCTVIVLSATLDRQRRQQLLGEDTVCQHNAYPLITALSGDQTLHEISLPPQDRPVGHVVDVTLVADDRAAVTEALQRAQTGQQVLWIENTVDEAQDRYLDLAARAREMGIDCGLLHSRFIAADRQEREQCWVSLFGREGQTKRKECGRLLIGTQVLEQSLDIDADFLVSRCCPTDMLLQRIGRLWRHPDTPRAADAHCEAWVLAPDLDQALRDEGRAFGPSAWIYSPYVLCRSLDVWQARRRICLPDDIRDLIESTYADREEHDSWMRMRDRLVNGDGRRKGRAELRRMAWLALATARKTQSEQQAQTRFSEMETVEVLLFRAIELQETGIARLTLLDGETLELPHAKTALSRTQWRQLGSRLLRQKVKVPIGHAPKPTSLHWLRKLGFQHCLYLGTSDSDHALPRFARIDEMDRLRSLDGSDIQENHVLSYRCDIGYRAIKS